jgi:hypothetical protein
MDQRTGVAACALVAKAGGIGLGAVLSSGGIVSVYPWFERGAVAGSGQAHGRGSFGLDRCARTAADGECQRESTGSLSRHGGVRDSQRHPCSQNWGRIPC